MSGSTPESSRYVNQCEVPPEGWYCTREAGHDGPCAAMPEGDSASIERTALEKIRLHGSSFWRDEWGTPARVAHDALNEADRAR
jgi:hypothetical protein